MISPYRCLSFYIYNQFLFLVSAQTYSLKPQPLLFIIIQTGESVVFFLFFCSCRDCVNSPHGQRELEYTYNIQYTSAWKGNAKNHTLRVWFFACISLLCFFYALRLNALLKSITFQCTKCIQRIVANMCTKEHTKCS